jgi:dihydroorotate dehydrogenase (NAD+) catalytic subunit
VTLPAGSKIKPINLEVDLAPHNPRGLRLANPVMTASGTFGYGAEFEKLFDIQQLGAIVCKGTTLLPRDGNPQPRIAETTGGIINSIGLQNIGVDALIHRKCPKWAKWRVPVIVNVAGSSIEEYRRIAVRLNRAKGVSGIELNISCPNVKEGGMEFGARADSAARVTAAVRKATTLPLIVKLTPNTADIVGIARAVTDAGADALCLINTLRGLAIDIQTRRPLLGNTFGGLSGPAIKPVALAMVYQVAGAVKIPIVGCGGIASGADALEFIMAGATAVEVGTASFWNPRATLDVLEELKALLVRQKVDDLRSLIGAALPK